MALGYEQVASGQEIPQLSMLLGSALEVPFLHA